MRVSELVVAALAASLWIGSAGAAQTAQQEIEKVIALYAESVGAADAALAAKVWSSGPDTTFIHPLGHEHGFEEIKRDVYVKLMGETFSARKLSVKNVSIHVYGNTAWAEFYWDFTATVRKDGTIARTAGRETQIYRKEPGGWRIVHVHYSAMP